MLDDGTHVMHSDIDERVKLRRLDTGEIVWESHLNAGGLGCLDYAFYRDDIILIFDVRVHQYVSFIFARPEANLSQGTREEWRFGGTRARASAI